MNKRLKWFRGNILNLLQSPVFKTLLFLILIFLLAFALYLYNLEIADKALKFVQTSLLSITLVLFIFTFKNNIGTFIDDLVEATILGNKFKRKQDSGVQDRIQKLPDSTEIREFNEVKKQYEFDISELKDSNKKLVDELVRTSMFLEFEKIYNIIFGSQILLLKVLKSNQEINNLFYDSQNIINYFTNVKTTWPPVLQNWTASLYMKFLIDNNLINYDSTYDRYYITNKSMAFLSYIEVMRYNEIKTL